MRKLHATIITIVDISVGMHGISRANPTGGHEGYAFSPGGWSHPSCVYEVPDGADVDDDGNVRLHGSIVAHHDPCPFSAHPARRDGSPSAASDAEPAGPASHGGWVEGTEQLAPGQSFESSYSFASVPNDPLQDGATLYYFGGLESTLDANCGILQPVLQWGTSPAGGGDYWAIGSWWWGAGGNSTHTTLATVNPGDEINFYMAAVAKGWSIVIYDYTTGVSKTLNVTTSCRFNVAFPAVFEVDQDFPITDCDQTSHNVVNMYDIQLGVPPDNSGVTYAPSLIGNNPGIACGFGIGSSSSDVDSTTSTTLWSSPLWSGTAGSSTCGQLQSGDALVEGQSISSCDGRFKLSMQVDGNLVLYDGSSVLWATGTDGDPGGAVLTIQMDGNLVLYDEHSGVFRGVGAFGAGQTDPQSPPGTLPSDTNDAQNAGDFLTVQNDGNVVVYEGSNPLWATNTCCH